MSERPIVCECECGGRHCASNRVSLLATANLPPTSAEQIAASQAVVRNRERTAQEETRPGAVARYAKWTYDEIALLHDRSLSSEVIAHQIGRTYFGVHSKRKRLGIDRKVTSWPLLR